MNDIVFRPVGRIVLRQIGPDRLLVPVSGTAVESNHLYPLNETGAFIWAQLEQGEPIDKIGSALSAAFEVESKQAFADCTEFITQLEQEGLVERVA